MLKFVCNRSGGLVSVRFLLGRLCLKCVYNAVFGFLSEFYVIPVYFTNGAQKTFLNAFYNVCFWMCLALVLRFRSCSRSASGLSPAGCVISSGLPDYIGRWDFHGFP